MPAMLCLLYVLGMMQYCGILNSNPITPCLCNARYMHAYKLHNSQPNPLFLSFDAKLFFCGFALA